MFRLQITLGLSIIFIVLGGLVYHYSGKHAQVEIRTQLEERLKGAYQSLDHLHYLETASVQDRASRIAAQPLLANLMSQGLKSEKDYIARHVQVDEFVQGWAQKLKEEGQNPQNKPDQQSKATQWALSQWKVSRPYHLMVVDLKGICVADLNDSRCFSKNDQGDKFTRIIDQFPILDQALKGSSFYDLWTVHSQVLNVGVAPVFAPGSNQSKVIGAVIIGIPLNRSIQTYKRILAVDVGYYYNDQIEGATSFKSEEETQLQTSMTQLLQEYQNDPKQTLEFRLNQNVHLAKMSKLSYPSQKKSGFFVVVNWDQYLEQALNLQPYLLLMCGIALLLALLLFSVAYHFFVEPLRVLEGGVQEVSNGNLEYWFTDTVSGHELTDALAYNLDKMVCKLSDRPLLHEDEQDEGEF